MVDITPMEYYKPEHSADVAREHEFILLELEVDDVLDIIADDVGAMEYLEDPIPRYYGSDFEGFYYFEDEVPIDGIEENDLYNPIVIADGILLDGYSRLSEHILNNIETINVFIAK
jgi:hypothetical protein